MSIALITLEINDYHARDFVLRCIETCGLTTESIIENCSPNFAESYRGVRESAYIGAGGFIEDMAFGYWLDYMQDKSNFPKLEEYDLHKNDKRKTTMSQEMTKVKIEEL